MKTISRSSKLLYVMIELDGVPVKIEIEDDIHNSLEMECIPGYRLRVDDPADTWIRDPDSDETTITIKCKRVRTDDPRVSQFFPQP